jgi:hypothetical protein
MTETAISEALELADMLQTFAYEQGFHECGYDPIKRLRAHIADLQSQLAAQRERDGRDAERYRWIRMRASSGPTAFEAVEDAAWTSYYGLPHNFDMNIDEAMALEAALVPVHGGEGK